MTPSSGNVTFITQSHKVPNRKAVTPLPGVWATISLTRKHKILTKAQHGL
jgi:hypothetical protein